MLSPCYGHIHAPVIADEAQVSSFVAPNARENYNVLFSALESINCVNFNVVLRTLDVAKLPH